jgi:pathogenesis-related protein 1
MKSLKDRPRPTTLGGTRGTCNTTQSSFWCLVTLSKLSRILLLWLVAMRPFLTLAAMVVSCSAQAQFPYSYGPYTPRDPPYGGQYAPPAQGRSPASMAQAMLDAHNAIRARVGIRPLVWSDQLARVAQDWANHLIATGSFGHRPNNQYGENAYTISGSTTSPAQVVGYWAGEARGYDVRSNTCSGVCGHYTQIVWGTTKAVGCAVGTDRRREVWVCNYDPPGNVIGYRPY